MIPNEVVTDIYMFGSRVLDGVVGYSYCAFVITPKRHMINKNIEISQSLPHPQQLSATAAGSNILCLGCGGGNGVLFLGIPTN
jgi:hypothetical protein